MKKLSLMLLMAVAAVAPLHGAKKTLPFDVRFVGVSKFYEVLEKGQREQWVKLPIGERVIAVAKELQGTPYKGFTLEIDDHIEAASANFEGLDCWTFFEVSLALARMLEEPKERQTPEVFLDYIELDRYRNGVCDGNYLSRLHYLAEWLIDNDEGGMVKDMGRELGGVRHYKECREMTILWKSYRYLRENPSLRPKMEKLEEQISKLHVYHIPKSRVAQIEPQLQSGDIIGITTTAKGGFCSHVGLAYRDEQGVLRFMHASSNHKKVLIDKRLSDYLHDFKYHAGIIVARPLQ